MPYDEFQAAMAIAKLQAENREPVFAPKAGFLCAGVVLVLVVVLVLGRCDDEDDDEDENEMKYMLAR